MSSPAPWVFERPGDRLSFNVLIMAATWVFDLRFWIRMAATWVFDCCFFFFQRFFKVDVFAKLMFACLFLGSPGPHFGWKKSVECLSSFARFSQKVRDVPATFRFFIKSTFSWCIIFINWRCKMRSWFLPEFWGQHVSEQHASRHSQLSFQQEKNDETVVENKISRPSSVPEF